MGKKVSKYSENDYLIEEFFLEDNYDIINYEMEKIKRKERREQKKKRDKDRKNRYMDDF